MKKEINLKLLILLSVLTTSIMTAFAEVPNQIQVSGITGTYADANGIYTKKTVRSAIGVGSSISNSHYSTSYDRNYWQRSSGSNNYYIYLSQYSSSAAYYWNIDTNLEDLTSNVLFYNNEPNAGGGYNVDNNDLIPQSPDLVSSWANSGALGSGSVTVTPVVAPIVTTLAATSITTTGVTLNGLVNANNASTIVKFEYGLTSSYGSIIIADQSPLSGSPRPSGYTL